MTQYRIMSQNSLSTHKINISIFAHNEDVQQSCIMIVIGGLKLFAARMRPFVSLNNRCDTNYLLLMNIEKEEHNLLN